MERPAESGRELLAIVLISLQLVVFAPSRSSAHSDFPPDGPPSIVSTVQVPNGVFPGSQDHDDGFDFDAEFELTLVYTHTGHPEGGLAVKLYQDIDFDTTSNWTSPPGSLYRHYECTPRNTVTVNGVMIEKDASTLVKAGVVIIGAGAAIAKYTGLIGAKLALGVALTGAVISLIGLANGDDNIGGGSTTAPVNGSRQLALRGTDGSVNLNVTSVTATSPAANPNTVPCAPPPQPYAALSGTDAAAEVYGLTNGLLADAGGTIVEEGNPGGLSGAELASITTMRRSLAVCIGASAATEAIQTARGFEGVDVAIASHAAAEAHVAASEWSDALEDYESAFLTAVQALEKPIPITPQLLPATLKPVVDHLATRRDVDVLIPMVVAGFDDGDPVGPLTVTGAPPGVIVDSLDLGPGYVALAVQTGAAEGPFTLTASVDVNGTPASHQITIDPAEPDPPLMVLGAPFAIDPRTGMLLGDGTVNQDIGPNWFAFLVSNIGATPQTNVTVGLTLEEGIISNPVVADLGALAPGETALAVYEVEFGGILPGNYRATARIQSDQSGPIADPMAYRAVNTWVTPDDPLFGNRSTFTVDLDNDLLTVDTESFHASSNWRSSWAPTALNLRLERGSPFPGPLGPRAFPDLPWGEVVLLGAAATAASPFWIIEPQAPVSCRGAALNVAASSLYSALAAISFADVEFNDDPVEPYRMVHDHIFRGELATDPVSTDLTELESLELTSSYPVEPSPGSLFPAIVDWTFTRTLDSGPTPSHGVTGESLGSRSAATLTSAATDQSIYERGESVTVTLTIETPTGDPFTGREAFVSAIVSDGAGQEQVVLMNDFGRHPDATPFDGQYSGALEIDHTWALGTSYVLLNAQTTGLHFIETPGVPLLTVPAGDTSCASLSHLTFEVIDGPFFADGFESGDTAAWSNILP